MTLMKDKNFPMWKSQFNLYLDEYGLWRCKGRPQNSNLAFAAKHPLILAWRQHFTELIMRDAHHVLQHAGVKETLTHICLQYWIVGCRSLVRSTIYRCVKCRWYDGQRLHAPPPPPLPAFRVNEAPPFTFTMQDHNSYGLNE